MMKRLIEVVIGIHTIGGVLFFSVLFSSKLGGFEKVMAGVLFSCISASTFLFVAAYINLSQELRRLNRVILEKTDHTSTSMRLLGLSKSSGEPTAQESVFVIDDYSRLPYLLCGIFAVWLVGGWAINRFIG
jgi:hypothetical protein